HPLINENKASNFGGKEAELWCPGGEVAFINKMITESSAVRGQCGWFTTLVSHKEYLSEFKIQLKNLKCKDVRTIEMNHGQKISHILAWRF
ncbi:MAG: 23S rRNA (adenine(1618)-N(6))-methyltransferase, partial [Elusimicrobia bacterium CG_4_10_14_3_um_filter_49_12_50_7]